GAYRMTDHDRAVVQIRHLTSKHRAPRGVTRVTLVGHPRIADLVLIAELSAQAFDEFVVPEVVYARAATLDEQDLPSSCHGDPPDVLATTRFDTHRWPESISVAGLASLKARTASPQRSQMPPLGCATSTTVSRRTASRRRGQRFRRSLSASVPLRAPAFGDLDNAASGCNRRRRGPPRACTGHVVRQMY